MKRIAIPALLCAALLSCGTHVEEEPLAVEGSQYAGEASISRSSFNAFSCNLCHAAHWSDVGSRILPGAVLEGVANRGSYWGGETGSLYEAVLRCWTDFMRGQQVALQGPTGEALNAWLLALSTGVSADGGSSPVPESFQDVIADITPGDPTNGDEAYHHACASCHGELNRGPVLGPLTAYIPQDTIAAHDNSSMCGTGSQLPCTQYVREIIIEKVRHGSFLGYDGNMPPFSLQALPDSQLADIIAYMNLGQYNLPQ